MMSTTYINANPHHLIPQYNGHFLPPYLPQSHQSGVLNSGYHSSTMQTPGVMTMKAIRVHTFGGPEVLNLEDQVVVPQVKDNQVLVRVAYAGVNPVETYIREGLYSRLPDLPYIPGSDASGYIHEVGSAVKNLKVGDRVFVAGTSSNSGSYAQFVVSDDTYVFPLHDRLTMEQGASLGVPFFTAYKALILRAQTRPGEVVLIHGASGAVGTAAVQIARALGATVVGTAGTKEGMEVVSRCGAHHVFNHNHKAYEKKMLEHLGTGFDVIIEHLANINLGHDLQMLKNGARVMIVGCRGTANINPRHLMLPEACIRGVSLGTSTADEWIEMGAAIVAGIEAGWVNPVINQVYNMEDVQKVHHDIIHSKGAKGKLVLRISNE